MRWRGGGRPRKNWMSCAVFWTSTRGEADEQLRELDFAGSSADARLDLVAFPLARGGAGGSVCRRNCGMPKRASALRAGGGRARLDDGIAGHHIHLVESASESGRADWGCRSFDVGGNVHPKRDRAVRLPRPCRRIPNGTADGDAVAGGSLVSRRPATELEDRGRTISDRKNAAQRDQAGGRRTVRKMCGAATENGSRPRHPVLRVPPAGRSSGAGMVPPRGAAAGEGADRLDRRA